jgi:cysteine desulfurase
VKLDKLGIAASTGSACSSGKEKPSHVLETMGLGDGSSDRMLRFSAGWETTESDWTALLEAIRDAARQLSLI